MNLYEIMLPVHNNAGHSYASSHYAWEAACLAMTGGFSRGASFEGAWQDGAGKVYRDQNIPYRVACTIDQFWDLIAKAFEHFPDQHAIASAIVGTFMVHERAPAIVSGGEVGA